MTVVTPYPRLLPWCVSADSFMVMRGFSQRERQIVLIACAAKKRTSACAARDLYVGDLFQKSLQFAKLLSPDAIYILSAEHGLVSLEDRLVPYNETLNSKSASQRRAWATRVLEQLRHVADCQRDQFTFLAGEKYREFLLPHLSKTSIPMEGLKIGQQLQFLRRKLRQSDGAM